MLKVAEFAFKVSDVKDAVVSQRDDDHLGNRLSPGQLVRVMFIGADEYDRSILVTNLRGKAVCWGSQLYARLFEELKKRSIHTAIGGIALPNVASIALHEKFGMTKVAHFKEVGFKFGEWVDVGCWQLNLAEES